MISLARDASPKFIDLLRTRAARQRRRIVFPESADPRVRTAVEFLAAERIVDPIVVLDPAAPDTHAAVHRLGVETIDLTTDPRLARTATDIFRARKKKGLTEAYHKNKTYGRLTEDEGTQDLADKASSAYTKEFLYSLSNTDREVLQTVDEALMRLERGEFGTCAECGQELNRKRLEAVPWASHCVTCQEKIEKGLL